MDGYDFIWTNMGFYGLFWAFVWILVCSISRV